MLKMDTQRNKLLRKTEMLKIKKLWKSLFLSRKQIYIYFAFKFFPVWT